ncbi:hypothetical protein JAAARDRAFT_56430 [Jaapia argillacea MUCL 33604]|uniref:Uncharacterized protein n=1 Tax=Jaapia argillacea MUCL 33604 TaxID=933084 RepID=A0A067Q7H4_9AGAM|nr:hypothetical protein JAAARDRAFT_56430 [Jaapia argillacea MUCL 33604]
METTSASAPSSMSSQTSSPSTASTSDPVTTSASTTSTSSPPTSPSPSTSTPPSLSSTSSSTPSPLPSQNKAIDNPGGASSSSPTLTSTSPSSPTSTTTSSEPTSPTSTASTTTPTSTPSTSPTSQSPPTKGETDTPSSTPTPSPTEPSSGSGNKAASGPGDGENENTTGTVTTVSSQPSTVSPTPSPTQPASGSGNKAASGPGDGESGNTTGTVTTVPSQPSTTSPTQSPTQSSGSGNKATSGKDNGNTVGLATTVPSQPATVPPPSNAGPTSPSKPGPASASNPGPESASKPIPSPTTNSPGENPITPSKMITIILPIPSLISSGATDSPTISSLTKPTIIAAAAAENNPHQPPPSSLPDIISPGPIITTTSIYTTTYHSTETGIGGSVTVVGISTGLVTSTFIVPAPTGDVQTAGNGRSFEGGIVGVVVGLVGLALLVGAVLCWRRRRGAGVAFVVTREVGVGEEEARERESRGRRGTGGIRIPTPFSVSSGWDQGFRDSNERGISQEYSTPHMAFIGEVRKVTHGEGRSVGGKGDDVEEGGDGSSCDCSGCDGVEEWRGVNLPLDSSPNTLGRCRSQRQIGSGLVQGRVLHTRTRGGVEEERGPVLVSLAQDRLEPSRPFRRPSPFPLINDAVESVAEQDGIDPFADPESELGTIREYPSAVSLTETSERAVHHSHSELHTVYASRTRVPPSTTVQTRLSSLNLRGESTSRPPDLVRFDSSMTAGTQISTSLSHRAVQDSHTQLHLPLGGPQHQTGTGINISSPPALSISDFPRPLDLVRFDSSLTMSTDVTVSSRPPSFAPSESDEVFEDALDESQVYNGYRPRQVENPFLDHPISGGSQGDGSDESGGSRMRSWGSGGVDRSRSWRGPFLERLVSVARGDTTPSAVGGYGVAPVGGLGGGGGVGLNGGTQSGRS